MSIFNVFSTLGEDLIQSLIPYVTVRVAGVVTKCLLIIGTY